VDFSVKIEGLDSISKASEQIRQAVATEVNKAVFASAQKVATEARKSILSGQKSGRTYKRRSVTHRASAPGEAPASDTGRLVNSIHAEMAGPGEAAAISGSASVKYARMLEFGTTKMAPRPFFFPALEKSKAWIRDRLQDALRRGLEKAGR
jgi:HK97 gp10 family phage protein